MTRYVVLQGERAIARFTSLDAVAIYLMGFKAGDVSVLAQDAEVIRSSTPYRRLTGEEQERLNDLL